MVLVDTSVLVSYLKGADDGPHQRMFQYVLDNNIPFGISPIIYLEVLQGVKTEEDFAAVKRYLDTQRVYGLKDERESYASAARIYYACRKKGVTVGSTLDCLIAQTAIENGLFLLHNDRDFDRISKIAGLKIFRA